MQPTLSDKDDGGYQPSTLCGVLGNIKWKWLV